MKRLFPLAACSVLALGLGVMSSPALAQEVPAGHWILQAGDPTPLAGIPPLPSGLESLVHALTPDHQVLAFDLTHPDLKIPVVRVIVSGLKNGYRKTGQKSASFSQRASCCAVSLSTGLPSYP